MKSFKLLILYILLPVITLGQQKKFIFPDEFSISISRTNLQNDNTTNKNGFGIGIYHIIIPEKKINFIFGFEFNHTCQLKKYIYNGHYSNSTDVNYYINSLSIPLKTRINFGRKIKIFLEAGGFIDLILRTQMKGTKHIYLNQNMQMSLVNSEFNENAGISGLNFGPSIGIGIKIPVMKHEFIFITDYIHGIRELSNNLDPIYNKYFRIKLGLKI